MVASIFFKDIPEKWLTKRSRDNRLFVVDLRMHNMQCTCFAFCVFLKVNPYLSIIFKQDQNVSIF